MYSVRAQIPERNTLQQECVQAPNTKHPAESQSVDVEEISTHPASSVAKWTVRPQSMPLGLLVFRPRRLTTRSHSACRQFAIEFCPECHLAGTLPALLRGSRASLPYSAFEALKQSMRDAPHRRLHSVNCHSS